MTKDAVMRDYVSPPIREAVRTALVAERLRGVDYAPDTFQRIMTELEALVPARAWHVLTQEEQMSLVTFIIMTIYEARKR